VPLRFEDLLAARVLSRQAPEKRSHLVAGLEAIREERSHKSLLAGLVDEHVLTMEQARYVHGMVERWKRGRGVAIYVHLLAREGVKGEAVKALVDVAGADADMNQLGDGVLGTGLLPRHREQQLRFQARLAQDRDHAMQLKAWLDAHRQQPGQPAAVPLAALDGGSARLDLSSMAAALPEEAQAIVRGTLSDADDELPGPQFRIPEWIDMSDPRTGKRVSGYRILGRVGAGAMGTVYLCDSQKDPSKPIALKLLPKDASADARGRFKREILANSFFGHPKVIEILDAGETDQGHQFMAMEFFDGKDLGVVLDAEKRLPPRRALVLAQQCFEALAACHAAGVVHRDVKPANVMVSRDGETAKLMDFGIAIVRDLGEFETKVFRSMEGGVTGTPEYMSPEQAGGDAILEPSDLYSMGCVLYIMLTGRLPFESETSQGFVTCHLLEDPLPLLKANPELKALPKELPELVDSLLQKAPARRPASAQVVVERIGQMLPKIEDKKGSTRGFWGMLWNRG
jgi:hypothetical protein